MPDISTLSPQNGIMTDVHCSIFRISLGWMGIVYSIRGLRRLVLPRDSKEEVLSEVGEVALSVDKDNSSILFDLPEQLRRYFTGDQVNFCDRLDLSSFSQFQQVVWNKARSIPYGQTRSYGWLAERIGKPQAMRAVGQALGRNPLPIIIPCHRVIRGDGTLGGFSGGLDMKRLLLRIEKSYTEV